MPSNPRLSPDGRLLLLEGCGGHLCEARYPLFLATATGVIVRRIAGDVQGAAWAEAGRQLVYASSGALVAYDLRTRRWRVVLRLSGYLADPAWLP